MLARLLSWLAEREPRTHVTAFLLAIAFLHLLALVWVFLTPFGKNDELGLGRLSWEDFKMEL